MTINDKVINILTTLGFTPETLSQQTNISLRNSKMIFKGTMAIKTNDFFQICILIGISPDLIMHGPKKAGDLS